MLHALLLSLPLVLQEAAPAETPRLVVVISVDQLVPEQLQRLQSRFTGGFARILSDGAVFWRATVDHAATETGPGHATLATGLHPAQHGIVGNGFLDRASGKSTYCVGDPAVRAVTSAGRDESKSSASPLNLQADALGDLIDAHHPESHTLSIAGKDRSAVLMGGRKPDAALWWNTAAGGFSSSSWYGDALPEFVNVWNSAWKERARGWKWESELGGTFAELGTGADDRAGERKAGGRTLPRTLPDDDGPLASAVLQSPLIDYFSLELATLAVGMHELGQDAVPDFLAVGLSACDILGHAYGADSVEVTDLLMRDDRDLGRFFAALDEQVGVGRWVACLSSDHGVLDLPEMLAEGAIGARRVGKAELQSLKALVDEALASAYEGADVGLRFDGLAFVLDEAKLAAAGLDPVDVRALVAEAARTCPWVADAYTLDELLAGEPRDPWMRLYRRSTTAERSPDVALRHDPWLLFDMDEGTSHGSPYPYDRRVPLAFLGGPVKAQQRFDAASPTDAVPTLLALLGLPVPQGLDGRVLEVD
jgi:predicted AlkP superfamily pyrophosphatase or phosphodiesterase